MWRFCYCFEHGAIRNPISIETAEAVADFLIRNCTEKEIYISWFGGEPIMEIDVIDLITDRLLSAGIKIESTITTNGILINGSIVNKFHHWAVTRVQITLDGLGEEYNKIKKYDLDITNPFERIVENIELVISSGISVHLRFNYKSSSYKEVYETMSYLHDRFGNIRIFIFT